jgi:hypothetical protein
MTYRAPIKRINRALGFQKWGVTNPWVFADFGQPQRLRGQVSPMIFQTHPPRQLAPFETSAHTHGGPLGQAYIEEDRARAQRMEWVAYASLGLSAWSLWFFYKRMTAPKANRRRRRA